MTLVTIIFSIVCGFIAGYIGSLIAMGNIEYDCKKAVRESTNNLDKIKSEIMYILDVNVKNLESSILSLDKARTEDGQNINKIFEAIKKFMKVQHAHNVEVDQAIYVLNDLHNKTEVNNDEREN